MSDRPGLRPDLAQVPHGRTAHRLSWPYLPAYLRAVVEQRLGSSVVDAASRDAGFTPGFASVLTGADGSRLFVKAASKQAQADVARAYLDEARKLRGDARRAARGGAALGARRRGLGRARLRRGRRPAAAAAVARRRARPGAGPGRGDRGGDRSGAARSAAEDRGGGGAATGRRTGTGSQPTGRTGREARALATAYASLPDRAFCHTDLRDDNVLLLDDGSALACDWNWPALGAAWQDTVDLLVSAYGDGLDVEPVLAERALTRDVDPEHVDMWLAALCGFMVASSSRPAPLNSPHLRTHSIWYAEALWGWLCERRGWA